MLYIVFHKCHAFHILRNFKHAVLVTLSAYEVAAITSLSLLCDTVEII